MRTKTISTPMALLLLLALFAQSMMSVEAAGPDNPGPSNPVSFENIPICGLPIPGNVRCHAILHKNKNASPDATLGPTGLNPADLQAAYSLSSVSASNGAGTLVAIVDAYDNPYAESDLAKYRSKFGLPPCTSANGCFKKVNQLGQPRKYPAANSGWAGEIALDIEMVSAICPNCKILLVEANSSTVNDLGASVNRAVAMGAKVVSNSYGVGEWSGSASWGSQFYNHPGVAITVSSGDNGYGVQFPANINTVTAVGGTSLKKDLTTGSWTESAWSGAGSGCSVDSPKPSWQTDTGCATRSVADVAAVADPYTGVSVYNTYDGGWAVYGGTSVAAPIIASTYALAGNMSAINDASYTYSHTTSLNDVTSGSNGTCTAPYLCTGMPGYDGPTGNGTPKGIGGF